MSKKYFSLSETARELECSESSVFKLIKQGKLSPSYVVNHVLRGRNKISGGQVSVLPGLYTLGVFPFTDEDGNNHRIIEWDCCDAAHVNELLAVRSDGIFKMEFTAGIVTVEKDGKKEEEVLANEPLSCVNERDVSECVLDMPIRVEMKEIVILGRDLQGYLESKGKTLSDGSSSVDKLLVVTDEPQKQSKQEEIDALMKEIRCNALADIAEERKKGTSEAIIIEKMEKDHGLKGTELHDMMWPERADRKTGAKNTYLSKRRNNSSK